VQGITGFGLWYGIFFSVFSPNYPTQGGGGCVIYATFATFVIWPGSIPFHFVLPMFVFPFGVRFSFSSLWVLFVCLCFIDTFDLFQCMYDSFIMYKSGCVCYEGVGCGCGCPCAHWLIHRPGTEPRPPQAPVICWQMSYNNVTLSVHHNKIIRPRTFPESPPPRSQGILLGILWSLGHNNCLQWEKIMVAGSNLVPKDNCLKTFITD